MDIINWFIENWVGILAAGTALFVAFDKIVKLTPTKADDEFLAKVEAAVRGLGLIK